MSTVKFTPLKRINTPKGDVLHGLKASDTDFSQFGEAYFTHIDFSETKGWKKHLKMDMNLLVPVGDVKFHLYNERGEYQSFHINKDNYGRLMVPAGHWMAFEGIGSGTNLILNIASIEHEPSEAVNIPLDELAIK